ncbi:MAG: oligosaccharide flippase family protein [Sneathiella sp.]|uniref:oligosaccharide flippase family protein n=1 Tax=Sneathiella sp. TaxID=1964365 RepID=UPI003002AFF8
MVISIPLQITSTLLQFAITIFITRTLDIDSYGAYVYVFTWATMMALFINLGFDQVCIREVPNMIEKRRFEQFYGLIVTILFVFIVTTFVAYLVLKLLLSLDFISLAPGAFLTILIAFVIAVNSSVNSFNNAFQNIIIPQLISILVMQGSYLALLFLWVASSRELDIEVTLVIYVVCVFAAVCVLLFLLIKRIKKIVGVVARPKLDPIPLLKASIPLVFVSFTYLINSSIDILMIGAYLEDSDIGIYRVASRGAALIGLILVIVNKILMPMLSKEMAKGNKDEAQKIVTLASTVLMGLGIISGLVIFFGASIFLGLFGAVFLAGEAVLKILLIASLADVFSGTVGALLILNRREKALFIINAFGILLNIILNFLLIGKYGIDGAAIATAVAILSTRIFMVAYVVRKTEYKPISFAFWKRNPINL